MKSIIDLNPHYRTNWTDLLKTIVHQKRKISKLMVGLKTTQYNKKLTEFAISFPRLGSKRHRLMKNSLSNLSKDQNNIKFKWVIVIID